MTEATAPANIPLEIVNDIEIQNLLEEYKTKFFQIIIK
jgi:hypothetical protein